MNQEWEIPDLAMKCISTTIEKIVKIEFFYQFPKNNLWLSFFVWFYPWKYCDDLYKTVCSEIDTNKDLSSFYEESDYSFIVKSTKLISVHLYPSFEKASTAFGPASMSPFAVFVKCIPRNGRSGSANG